MRTLLRLTVVCAILLVSRSVRATHNEAGEILVCHLGGLRYQVTIITHTNPNSPADRPDFILDWGDGFIDTIPRIEPPTQLMVGTEPVQQNRYVSEYAYSGPGVYTLQYIDPNRIAGIENIPNSVDVPMCVQSQIIVTADFNDCLPVFLNLPIQQACIYQPWIHNPAAFDADGDSLSFEPVVCLGPDTDEPADGWGDPIAGYVYPDGISPGPNNQYSIDPVSGTITWDSPQLCGFYNIAFIVREWRNGMMIGWVERDMLIIVECPCNNEPPVLTGMIDTCVLAGTHLTFSVQASDPDAGQQLELDAYGGPLVAPQSPAVFTTNPGPSPVNGTFSWFTNCSHVRQQPYQVVFSVQDNYGTPLFNFANSYIKVVAPEPLNPTATPDGSIMRLHWDPDECTNAIGYSIYRRQNLYGFDPEHCELGVPGYTGYVLVDTVMGWANTDYDDHDLVFGLTYCYMVTAFFLDGGESYASEEFCGMLERDVPIMTNVTVMSTDVATGGDSVVWSNAWDLDTGQYPGPYFFKLYEGTGFNTATNLIYTSASSPFLQNTDTAFQHLNINTVDVPHVYRVELYNGTGDGELIGTGNTASSVFLDPEPNDEQITLHMTHNTPWVNTLFDVFRETSPGVFTHIGSSTTETYVDSNLVNGQQYCYYARTTGAYSDPGIVSPLINFSQIACDRPVDLTPPCAPTLTIDNDCETPMNTLTWNNPNESCADDTYRYNIWFTDSLGGELQVIASIVGAEITFYEHTDGMSVAGCYAVTAIDTVGNESLLSDTVCGDNCPVYELPNVFTPNSDDQNDFFVPFPYRGVKEIQLQIFNRWGMPVFTSENPDIHWPGTYKETADQVPDGVYFYTCNVVMKRLAGDEVKQLKGYVHILRGKQAQLN